VVAARRSDAGEAHLTERGFAQSVLSQFQQIIAHSTAMI
jgi:hypothetical protein